MASTKVASSILIICGGWGVLGSSLLAQTVTFTEYPVPTTDSRPLRIVAGADGALWFTELLGNKIGRITTAGVLTEFNVPTSSSQPVVIAAGQDGALWFTEQNGNKIGRITTAGVITEFPVPTAATQLVAIAAGPDGALWFTELLGNKIGRITTAGVISEFNLTTSSSQPVGIGAGSDGNLWFTEQTANKIGRITTAGTITEFPVPTPASQPGAIIAGSDGALWFIEVTGNKIGRITTTGVITEFPLPTAASGLIHITNGPDSALWFSEMSGNRIGRITTTGTITEYPAPTSGASLGGVATGPDGNVWFAETLANKIGRVNVCTLSAPVITKIVSARGFGGLNTFTSGSYLEITGSNLAGNTREWLTPDFIGNNAPTFLDGVSVSIKNKPGFISYISPGQINVQAPDDTATGPVAITVTNCFGTSAPVSLQRASIAPGLLAPPPDLNAFFTVGNKQYLVASFATQALYVYPTVTPNVFQPAKPGDSIWLYGIGFGSTTPAMTPGVIATGQEIVNAQVAVKFGQTSATVAKAFLYPTFVGLYTFIVTVPDVADGEYQINVTVDGQALQQPAAFLYVKR